MISLLFTRVVDFCKLPQKDLDRLRRCGVHDKPPWMGWTDVWSLMTFELKECLASRLSCDKNTAESLVEARTSLQKYLR